MNEPAPTPAAPDTNPGIGSSPSMAKGGPVPVRAALPDDIPELVRLRKIMLDSLSPSDDTSWTGPAEQQLRERLAASPGTLAVYVVDRPGGPGLAACVAGTVERRLASPGNPLGLVGHVFNVTTDPAHRRRGYARACMAALLGWYERQGVPVIDLHTTDDGEALYASLGFRRNREPAMRLRR